MNIDQWRKQCISNVNKSSVVEESYIRQPLLHEAVSYQKIKNLKIGNRYK